MPKTRAFSDGSYFDSTGIYDTSLGMTQQAINNAVSHVGQIIFSTTLDTMEKVVAVYGGTTWAKIEGQFLIGASDSYANGSTGGEASHELLEKELPARAVMSLQNTSGSAVTTSGIAWSSVKATAEGYMASCGTDFIKVSYNTSYLPSTGQAHNNMPPYRAVYIWERTA